MKKPVLLVVDDDRAVLGALEALLSPEFSEICRIETFERPEDVLAAVPGWQAEQRPLALAIVDQKMPGMPGVELIHGLRGAVAEPFKGIILTGYAGVDSAVEGKNEAGIDGYVEKPWEAVMLAAMVKRLLGTFLRETERDRYLIFREARTEAEIEALMKKRYEIYRTGAAAAFLRPGVEGIDMDGWDLHAKHMALFRVDAAGMRLSGNMRVVLDGKGEAESLVREIATRNELPSTDLDIPEDTPFPLLAYWPDAEAVRRRYRAVKARGETLAEPGRLAVDPSERRPGVAFFVTEAATGYFFFLLLLDHAVLTCRVAHYRLYSPLGFEQVSGTGIHEIPGMELKSICLWGSKSRVPEPVRARVLALAERVERCGSTCHCHTYPSCIPAPYVSGDFRDVDLFCPLQAGEIVGAAAGA